MTITDAFFVDPMAMEHARQILAVELDMLRSGATVHQRIDWLASQRNSMCGEAALFIPTQLVPLLDSMSTQDTLALLNVVQRNLASMKIGTTFRHLRNAERRMGLSGFVLDPLMQHGAMLLLEDDADFTASLARALEPVKQHMESNPAFQIGQQRFDEIMSRTDLETNKQRDVMEYAMQSVPDLLVGLPDLDGTILREFVYMYGRLLDQDIMRTLSVIIRELGAGIFDQISGHIIDRALITYRTVITGLINDRITEINTTNTHHQPTEIAHSVDLPTPPPLPDGLVTIKEAAAFLRINRVTVERLIKNGALEGTHVGRKHLITRKSIDIYLALSS
ncbi:MAG: helix-turn-helix domain-containing protein [Ignavibacteria bacterium]|nr:helix-turn-helix domain-containing protein [Ignavibacteria bacterium]